MSKLDQIRALREGRMARKNSRGGSGRGAPQTVPRSPRQAVPQPDAELVPGPREARSTSGRRVEGNPRPRAERLQQEPATPDTVGTAKRKPRAAKHRDVGNVAKPEAPPTAHRGRRRSSEPKPKVGRPRAEDRGKTLSDTKPWVKAKVSRATWYRQKRGGSL